VRDADHGDALRKTLEENFDDVKWHSYHIDQSAMQS